MKPALVLDIDETLISSSILKPSSECLLLLKNHRSNHHRSSSNVSSPLKRQSVPNMSKLVQKIEIEDHNVDDIDLIMNEDSSPCYQTSSDFQSSSDDNYDSIPQKDNAQLQDKSFYEDYEDKSVCFTVKFNRRRVYVTTRPGLQSFYSTVKKMFDIYFFTSSEKKYADQIIDFIDDSIPHERRFFRDSCICYAGYYVKDLSILKRDLQDVVLLDDTEGCALKQPKNLIRVNPWYGYSFSPLSDTTSSLVPKPSLLPPNRIGSIPESSTNINESNNFSNPCPKSSSLPPQQLRRKSHNDLKQSSQSAICNKIDNELNGRILPLLIKFSQEFYIRHSMNQISEISQLSQIQHQRDNEIEIKMSTA